MMSSRKRTPDLMSDILGSDDISKSVDQHQQTNKPTSNPNDYLEAGDKIRATFYFLPDTLNALEKETVQLKTLVEHTIGRDKRRHVSKSLLVERAVRLMLEDYEQNGADSLIARDLMRIG